jgi:hypothetical protein
MPGGEIRINDVVGHLRPGEPYLLLIWLFWLCSNRMQQPWAGGRMEHHLLFSRLSLSCACSVIACVFFWKNSSQPSPMVS